MRVFAFKKLDAYRMYLLLSGGTALFFTITFTLNMIYQITVVGLSPLQLVLVGTMLEVSVFFFEVPTGIVADAYSRRLSIIIGLFLIGAGFLLEGLIPVFEAVLLAQVLWGVGYTFTSGATQAWISDEIGEERTGAAFIRGAQVGQVVGVAGVIIAVVLGSVQINLPIVVGGVGMLLMGGVLVLFMPEDGFKPTPREDRTTWQNMLHILRTGMGVVRVRPMLVTILSVGLVFGLYSEGLDRLTDKHLLDSFALPGLELVGPAVWFGMFGIVGMPLGFLVTEVVRRRVDTNNHAAVARASFILTGLMVVGILTFALAINPLLAMAAITFTAAFRGALNPVYQAWLNQNIDSDVRATMFSMSGQVDAIGQIGGGPLVGVVADRSVRAALSCSGLILAAALPLIARTLRAGKKTVVVEGAGAD